MHEYYICHHGIPGQKWGVRNGPPYPLSSEKNIAVRRSRFNKESVDKKRKNKTYSVKLKKYELIKGEGLTGKSKDDIILDLEKVNDIKNKGYAGRVFNCQNCSIATEMRFRGFDVQARQRTDGSNAYDVSDAFENAETVNVKTKFSNDLCFKRDPIEFRDDGYGAYADVAEKHDKEYADSLRSCQKEAYDHFISELKSQPTDSRGAVIVGWVSIKDNKIRVKNRSSAFHAFNYYRADDDVIFIDTEGKHVDYMTSEVARQWLQPSVNPKDYVYCRFDNLDFASTVKQYVEPYKESKRK